MDAPKRRGRPRKARVEQILVKEKEPKKVFRPRKVVYVGDDGISVRER